MTTLEPPLRKDPPILTRTRAAIADMRMGIVGIGCRYCGLPLMLDYEHIRVATDPDMAGRLRYLVWCENGHKEEA